MPITHNILRLIVLFMKQVTKSHLDLLYWIKHQYSLGTQTKQSLHSHSKWSKHTLLVFPFIAHNVLNGHSVVCRSDWN